LIESLATRAREGRRGKNGCTRSRARLLKMDDDEREKRLRLLDETDDDQGQRRAKNKQTSLLEALGPLKIK
jgi:hypothetical protein